MTENIREKRNSNKLLREIQQLDFMLVEAGMFLNNQKDCEAAQEAFCHYKQLHEESREEYERCYGPLTYDGVNVKRDGWSWVEGPWPWEGEK